MLTTLGKMRSATLAKSGDPAGAGAETAAAAMGAAPGVCPGVAA
jgi:hypothetical protein